MAGAAARLAAACYNPAMNRSPLLRLTSAGLYCELGGFHIDPWHPVARAVITHGHADHFAAGCKNYLTAASGRKILQQRLGPRAVIQPVEYVESLECAKKAETRSRRLARAVAAIRRLPPKKTG